MTVESLGILSHPFIETCVLIMAEQVSCLSFSNTGSKHEQSLEIALGVKALTEDQALLKSPAEVCLSG